MAALIVVSGLLFALGATAVTPLSASTSNQHIQNQQLAMANDVLATADRNGTLREAVLFWNTSRSGFNGSGDSGYFTDAGPPNPFGGTLNETFKDEQIAFNVYVFYWDGTARKSQPMTYMGSPSDNAVAASRTVVVYDDAVLSGPGASVTVSEAADDGGFYAPDVDPETKLFNVLEVRIVTWRM